MKSTMMILVFVLAAFAGVFSLNWNPVEDLYSSLEIQAKGAVIKTIEAEEGVFPDSTEVIESYYVIPEGCISCQICVGQCPTGAITMGDDNIAVIDPELCINCGICASNCPTSTIEVLKDDYCSLYGVDTDGNAVLLQENLTGDITEPIQEDSEED